MGRVALKLDMNKAYERIEWYYVIKVMRRMGFLDKWLFLIRNIYFDVHVLY